MLGVRYAKRMMSTTIEEVASVLGVSVRGVRLRVDALRDVVAAHLRQGENNRILFDGDAVAVLRRMEELRKATGCSIRQAASRIREELAGNSTDAASQSKLQPTSSMDALQSENALLRDEVTHLRSEVAWLRAQVDELRPLALPRSRWWERLFRPLSVRGQSI
jgi:DNA-binding transcriptional MerR regulator